MTRRSVLVLAVVVVALVAAGGFFIRRGFSARDEPSAVERIVARAVRSMAVPSEAKQTPNPVAPSDDVLTEARAHFADHCATCHANDGGGKTDVGQNLYPKAPDMRLPATQQLTDGEIYNIIHNGIRLTGMPAWGEADHDLDSWKLVHFIRHLPSLTPDELQQMEALNPVSPAEIEEKKAEEDFLKGIGEPADDTASDTRRTTGPTNAHQH